MSYISFFMKKEICPIYGPLAICSYGVAIVIGLAIFCILIRHDPWYKKLGGDSVFSPLITAGIFAAFIGGRVIYWITESNPSSSWSEIFHVWEGGFSILGSIIGVLCVYPFYLMKYRMPVIPTLDLVAVYAPILQSLSRLGCFCAGCCYGCHTTVPWAIMYTDPQSNAPLHQLLHPTQLYSALALFTIFVALYTIRFAYPYKKGVLISLYLIFVGLERFAIDYWRAERLYIDADPYKFFTVYQTIALSLVVCGSAILYYALFRVPSSAHTQDKTLTINRKL